MSGKKNIILEQITDQFVKSLSGPPIYTYSPEDARNILNSLQKDGSAYNAVTSVETIYFSHDEREIELTVIRPLHVRESLPIIVYFHGGGWVLGNNQTHNRLIRRLAHDNQAAVVFVNYTPSPEAHYPVAIEEGYAAVKFIAKNASQYNLNADKLIIAGDSVGGNMAAVVALLAKERGGPTIIQQILLYPVTDASMQTESYELLAEGPWLTKKGMEWFWDAYMPDKSGRMHPHVSPLQASLEQLQGLPPALIITDEYDVLRDEGEAYAHKLMQADVNVTGSRFLGTIHDFMMLNALEKTPAVEGAFHLIQATLKNIDASKSPLFKAFQISAKDFEFDRDKANKR